MAGFFPVYFRQYWATTLTSQESTYQLGLANSIASLVIVLIAPIIGSIADQSGNKKRFLLFFTYLGLVMCAALFFVVQDDWQLAIIFYIVATIGFSGGVFVSDSLLLTVTDKKNLDRVSAFGYAMGYIGGGILFAISIWLVRSPELIGLTSPLDAIRFSFLLVAIWWAVFSIPVFLFVHEPDKLSVNLSSSSVLFSGFIRLIKTFKSIRQYKIIVTFLLAYWLYIDGVDTIVRMAVDYGLALGLDSSDLIMALLLTQFIGFPSAIAFGYLGEWLGAKTGIQIALVIYVIVVLLAYQLSEVWEFYMLAIMIGLVQGGIQSLSRSLYASIIPADRSAEFFGFYNMLGKFSAVIGPVMIGLIVVLTGSHRVAMLSIIILFVAGSLFLYRVDVEKGRQLVDETKLS
ncbi:MAG: MFS transporter [Gammaproteobacteria bacterium]|nr:MFS transporter [Gammaproteobacteria bacterium]